MAAVDVAHQGQQRILLLLHLLDLLVVVLALGLSLLQLPDLLAQRPRLGRQRVTLFALAGEGVQDGPPEVGLALRCSGDEPLQVLSRVEADPVGEHLLELSQQRRLLLPDEREQAVREVCRVLGVKVAEDSPDLGWQLGLVACGGHPAIEAEGGELALQHRRGVEEDAGRRDLAGEHLGGVGEEVEVVGLAFGDGEHERVAVTPAGASDALRVVGLRGRHGVGLLHGEVFHLPRRRDHGRPGGQRS